MTTVYISLKRLYKADDECHTGSLHTGLFAQLGSGSRSKCESQSISLGGQRGLDAPQRRCSTLGAVDGLKGYKTVCFNNTETQCEYQ